MKNIELAHEFFKNCESGNGWSSCEPFCLDGATFSSQAGTLAHLTTIKEYAEWMKQLLTPIPDASYDVSFFSGDESGMTVVAVARFNGTHSVDLDNLKATHKKVSADYCFSITLKDGKVSSVNKIWNDHHSLLELGWI